MKEVHERLAEMTLSRVDEKVCGREKATGKWFHIAPRAGWKEAEVTGAEAERLEWILQNYDEYCEKIREEKYGPRPKNFHWDYLSYLDACERAEGGKVSPAGNIEPADGEHEPWAAARMAH